MRKDRQEKFEAWAAEKAKQNIAWRKLMAARNVSTALHIGWFPKSTDTDGWGLVLFGSYIAVLERVRY